MIQIITKKNNKTLDEKKKKKEGDRQRECVRERVSE